MENLCLYIVMMDYIYQELTNNNYKFCHDCLSDQDLVIAGNQFGSSFKNQCNSCKEKNKPMKAEDKYKLLYGDKWRTYLKYKVDNEADFLKRKKEIQEERIAKQKDTMMVKYGVDNTSKLQETKDKKSKKSLEKYGTTCVFQAEEIKNKIGDTNEIKYNSRNVFGSEEIKIKIRETVKNKYGTEWATQNEDVKEKTKQTCLDRFGVSSPMKSDEIKKKIIDGHIQKYGISHPLKIKYVDNKRLATNLDKYKTKHPFTSKKVLDDNRMRIRKLRYDDYITNLKHKNLIMLLDRDSYINSQSGEVVEFKCTNCDSTFESVILHETRMFCDNCITTTSSAENELKDWLISLGIKNIEQNKRFYYKPHPHRYDIDLYLPDYNYGIEYHGLYYHKYAYNDSIIGKSDKKHHQNQYKFFKEKGIRLVQVFENEYLQRPNIVKSIIKSQLGLSDIKISSDDCIIIQLDNQTYKEFLNDNNLYGYTYSTIRLGLLFKNELVSVIGISKSKSIKYQYEIIRFCSKLNTTITGSFNKLFSYFKTTNDVESVISYVDVRYFDGGSYKDWEYDGMTDPNYYYFKSDLQLHNRMKYQKHKLENLLEYFESDLTEEMNMFNNGFNKIYDAGNLIFRYKS